MGLHSLEGKLWDIRLEILQLLQGRSAFGFSENIREMSFWLHPAGQPDFWNHYQSPR